MSSFQQLGLKYQINFNVWHCIEAQFLLQPLLYHQTAIALCKFFFSLLNSFLFFFLFYIFAVEANQAYKTEDNPSLYINDAIWKEVRHYLIPNDHPIKENLDQIFSSSRVLANQESMRLAGFTSPQPQPETKVVVTKHRDLPGYIFKAYLDVIKNIRGNSEYIYLIKRIRGALLVQKSIKTHHYEHLFKVPQKWLYLLPDHFPPPPCCNHKMFILVEEDMDIFNNSENKKLWGSELVTKELLRALYTVAYEVGLADIKPDNCPFSKDGKVAFVDTQGHGKRRIDYNKLTFYLSPPMQAYWKNLNQR